MAKQFKIGDKVFAKVRGYPPWPAQIEQIDDLSRKCHVVFYGTFETSVCKVDDVFLYDEFKEKFRNRMKRKNFREALTQIENEDILPRLISNVAVKSEPRNSGCNGKLDENCNTGGKKLGKRKRENSVDSLIESAVQDKQSLHSHKRFKKSDSVSSAPPPVITKSGRIVKPKKFPNDTFNTSLGSIGGAGNNSCLKSDSTTQCQEVGNPNLNSRLSLLGGNIVVENGKTWTASSSTSNSSISQMTNGESKIVKDKETEEDLKVISQKKRMMWFQIEASLLELAQRIQDNLTLQGVDIERTLEAARHLYSLNVQPIMLKKHPHVVNTILRMRRYVGNTDDWNCTDDQRTLFFKGAQKIRHAAGSLLHKFTELLDITDDNLVVPFQEILTEFERKTSALSPIEFCALMHDPTAEGSVFFPEEIFCEEILNSGAIWEAST